MGCIENLATKKKKTMLLFSPACRDIRRAQKLTARWQRVRYKHVLSEAPLWNGWDPKLKHQHNAESPGIVLITVCHSTGPCRIWPVHANPRDWDFSSKNDPGMNTCPTFVPPKLWLCFQSFAPGNIPSVLLPELGDVQRATSREDI